MHRDAEVAGDQVRQAVGRHLVGDVEHLTEVLDRDVLVALGLGEHLHDRALGRQQCAGEVVGLNALPHIGLEVRRLAVAEREVSERLRDHRSRGSGAARGVALRDIDDAVGRVGDRPGRCRQALHPRDRETEVGGGLTQVTLRDGAGPGVADSLQRFGRDRLDLLKVVVASPHLVAQRRVGCTRAERTGDDRRVAERRVPFPSVSSRTRANSATMCSSAAPSRRAEGFR